MRWQPQPLLACALVATAVAAGGCVGGQSSDGPSGAIVHVTERDFTIHAPARIPAGDAFAHPAPAAEIEGLLAGGRPLTEAA